MMLVLQILTVAPPIEGTLSLPLCNKILLTETAPSLLLFVSKPRGGRTKVLGTLGRWRIAINILANTDVNLISTFKTRSLHLK